MKTIKERATKYADGHASCYIVCGRWSSCENKCRDWFVLYNGYYDTATEQRDIDVERACEWLKRELADPMPEELYKQWCSEKLSEFRKAMTEQ